MTLAQRRKIWANLASALTLMGVLVIVLSGLGWLLQQNQAVAGPDDAASPLQTNTARQIDYLQSRLQSQLQVQPQDQDTYTLLGGAYLQKARETGDAAYYARAEGALRQSLELDPGNARAMSLLGSLSLARHDFRMASQWAQRALEVNPDYAAAYGVLGDAQIEQGQYQAGVESYQKMVDLKPNLDSYARVSYIRKLMGDVEGAMAAMAEAVDAGPPGNENTAWAEVQLGDLYFGSGRIDEAAERYEAALREFPGYYLALASLARSRAAQGQFETAVELYQAAVDIIPRPTILAELGDLYAKNGQIELARSQYAMVEFIAELAVVNQQGYNRELARFYADHGTRLDQALELATSELALRQDIYGYDTLAWALYQNHRFEEAAAAIGRALHLDTRDAVLHYHAGKIFQGLGDPERAAEHLERALELNPYFSLWQADDARQALTELRLAG
ncbi:MAG TPA: tetratricopeptide repeat protein [Dehalococcoidia bacterium]|nr:tetratricopeptide repeat protein [Dehalococcoidia bacterium]